MNFGFGVPLKSKIVSKDWRTVERVFARTLRSLIGQTLPDIKIMVACHDVPDVAELNDHRVEVIRAEYDEPLYPAELMIDKHKKRELIAARWHALGGGYLMYVDADDLVSSRLAAYVLAQTPCRGFYLKNGYDLNEATNKLNLSPRFYKICGTNCVINWAADELPAVPFQRRHVLFRDTVAVGNAGTRQLFLQRGEPLQAVPFPAAVYVRSHGDNATDVLHTESWRRRLIRAITPGTQPNAGFKREFALA
jgi:hypothetical protein